MSAQKLDLERVGFRNTESESKALDSAARSWIDKKQTWFMLCKLAKILVLSVLASFQKRGINQHFWALKIRNCLYRLLDMNKSALEVFSESEILYIKLNIAEIAFLNKAYLKPPTSFQWVCSDNHMQGNRLSWHRKFYSFTISLTTAYL